MPSTDQGIGVDRYRVIPRTLIFLQRDRSFLLLKGDAKKRLWANKFNGIGGHVERGESAMDAAIRELAEETGLHAELWQCGTLLVDTGSNTGVCVFVFKGTSYTGDLKPSLEGSVDWISMDSLEQIPVVEDLPLILRRIMNMEVGDPPFHAHSHYYPDGNFKMIID